LKRKGVGDTLGTLFFLGILISTVIPFQLYIKENKITYLKSEQSVHVQDEYRLMEDLNVIAYPQNLTSNEIILKVKNPSPVPINIQRIWIKDDPSSIGLDVSANGEEEFGPFTCELEENSTYPIKVTTGRGRSFSNDGGNLIYFEGTWYSPSFGIQVIIANDMGKYHISVSNSTWSSEYQTQGQDHGDLLVFFDVSVTGPYYVVMRKNSSNGPDLPGSPLVVEVMWPNGPPIVYVYSSGKDV
jgi:hypothetical protein